jgi:secondary thiamine-phosphate synthase enzyme
LYEKKSGKTSDLNESILYISNKINAKLHKMRQILQIKTDKHNGLYDITDKVTEIVRNSKVANGIASIYAQGATSAIMIQENWDNSVQNDVVDLLNRLIPGGIWQHDMQDSNGDSHLKAGLVGPSEVVPIIDGKLGLSQWQNIFFCEFDGPRNERRIVITIIPS